MSFLPASFSLEPGTTQTVRALVQPCPTFDACSATMVVGDMDRPSGRVQTVISINQYSALHWRQLWLLGFAILGSVLSVVLNNLFPATHAKQALRDDLRRIEDLLRDCPNAGDALLDQLNAEATRLKLVLHQISFTDSTKETALQSARQATAALSAGSALARRLSLLRTDADGAILSIAIHAVLRGKLRDAEEALRAGDAESASSRLNEAQAQLTQARNDGEQAELRRTLGKSIDKLMRERGIRPPLPPGSPPDAPPLPLNQPTGRDTVIHDLVDQLDQDGDGYANLNTTDLLDAERDFYVADVWTEYMERKLAEFDRPAPAQDTEAWAARKQDWIAFSRSFLQCLRRTPNSDQTQNMIDLIRRDTTPQDIAAALRAGSARLECDPQPKYLEGFEAALKLTDPLLRDVAAVRRLLSYRWEFNDGTTPPPNVDRCRHYFQPPPFSIRRKQPPRTYQVSVEVSVPFTDLRDIAFTQMVTPRPAKSISITRWTGWISFLVTAAIAVVTAFGAKYATSVPDIVGWPDCLTAFMLGFGLDQLRDAVNAPAVSTPPSTQTVVTHTATVPAPAAGSPVRP